MSITGITVFWVINPMWTMPFFSPRVQNGLTVMSKWFNREADSLVCRLARTI
jgi:hypothetical protein